MQETKPLLGKSSTLNSATWKKWANYIVCVVFGFPTVTLSGLAALAGSAAKAGELHTTEDLGRLISQAGAARLIYAVFTLMGAQAVTFFEPTLFVGIGQSLWKIAIGYNARL